MQTPERAGSVTQSIMGSVMNSKETALYKEEAASDVEVATLPSTLQGLSKEEIRVLEKKLVRRIDLRLLPMLVIMYILNYLDRNNMYENGTSGIEYRPYANMS